MVWSAPLAATNKKITNFIKQTFVLPKIFSKNIWGSRSKLQFMISKQFCLITPNL